MPTPTPSALGFLVSDFPPPAASPIPPVVKPAPSGVQAQLIEPDIPDDTVPADQRVAAVLRLLPAASPLRPIAELMVALSDDSGVDWRLLPVISMLESTGGLYACEGNAWGWRNCDVTWDRFEDGANAVAYALSQAPYAGHDFATQLCIWKRGQSCSLPDQFEYVAHAAGFVEVLENR